MNTKFCTRLFIRVALLVVLLFLGGNIVKAQNDIIVEDSTTSAQSFSLVYIAQDASMPIEEIEKKLQTAWNRAVQSGPTIFYLSRGREEPIIVKIKTHDDNRADYDSLMIPAIYQGETYSVDGPQDKRNILKLLEEYPFVTNDGTPIYGETNFDFHVGQDFWTSDNNEAIIASLFFELDIRRFIADDFHFNVFCPRTLIYNEDVGPFGLFNPDDCRRYINLDRSYSQQK